MKTNIFSSGEFYDLFYKEKNYEKEANYIHNKLKNNGIPRKQILEFGCGTGKHAEQLIRYGYEIVGIEQSQSMINEIKEIKGLEIIKGDIRKIKLERQFGAIISLFHVISYQITNNCLKKVFKRAYECLDQGGIFIFDTWYGPAVLNQKPEIRIKKVSNSKYSITRVAEPELLVNKNQVNIKYTFNKIDTKTNLFQTIEERHTLRYFTIPELEYVANDNGFKIIEVEEFLTSNETSLNSWGACFVLKKNG